MKVYPVAKRCFGEERDIREFVQPWSLPVQELAESLRRPTLEETITASWDWVARNIDYPPGPLEKMDRHYREAFLSAGVKGLVLPNMPGFRSTVYDHWGFPAETLALGMGDCDDAAVLLCSLLRNFLPEDRVFATAGLFGRWGGHVWVSAYGSGSFVLEATLSEALPGPWVIPEEEPYIPIIRFNDRRVVEVGELPQGFLSGRLSGDGALAAVGEFYRSLGLRR
jgi:transglutaminase-like putative cysteine protease